MRFQPAHLVVLVALTVPACSNGGNVSGHPKITQAQIQKDAEAFLYSNPMETDQ